MTTGDVHQSRLATSYDPVMAIDVSQTETDRERIAMIAAVLTLIG